MRRKGHLIHIASVFWHYRPVSAHNRYSGKPGGSTIVSKAADACQIQRELTYGSSGGPYSILRCCIHFMR